VPARNASHGEIVHAPTNLNDRFLTVRLKGERMDPQIAWDQLHAAYAAGDWDILEERATD
jgi:hypothetical protein